jgi:hypothetical protein
MSDTTSSPAFVAGMPNMWTLEMEYAADNSSVNVFDCPVIGWLFQEGSEAVPQIIGRRADPLVLESNPPWTPPWALVLPGTSIVMVPDRWRGTFNAFLTWLASGEGANRTISGNFSEANLQNAWKQWARLNPTRALSPVVPSF